MRVSAGNVQNEEWPETAVAVRLSPNGRRYLGHMADVGSARSGFVRWMIGKPRIWVGAAWFCIGLAWILLAAFDGPTSPRILAAALALALGVFQGAIALHDRKHGRGFYQTPGAADDVSEHD